MRGINAAAAVHRTRRSEADLRCLFGIDTLSRRAPPPPLPPPPPPGPVCARGAEALLAASAADDRIRTLCFAAAGALDEARLREWLVRLCARRGRCAHRDGVALHRRSPSCGSRRAATRAAQRRRRPRCCAPRGCCAFLESPRRGSASCRRACWLQHPSAPGAAPETPLNLQVVRQLYDITDARAPVEGPPAGGSRLLLIGRHLDAAALAASLQRAVGPFALESS